MSWAAIAAAFFSPAKTEAVGRNADLCACNWRVRLPADPLFACLFASSPIETTLERFLSYLKMIPADAGQKDVQDV
jgi:hypothetical protein